nr:MAG TPA: hypothetical protein [Caudoviricetes sp.]
MYAKEKPRWWNTSAFFIPVKFDLKERIYG